MTHGPSWSADWAQAEIFYPSSCVRRQQTAEQQLQHALDSGDAVDVVSTASTSCNCPAGLQQYVMLGSPHSACTAGSLHSIL